MKAKSAGILAATLGTICCAGPLVLVAIGLGAGAAIIGKYHWFFIGGAVVVLAWAWAKFWGEKTACACGQRQMEGRRTALLTLLVATAIVLGFAALNVRTLAFARAPHAAQAQPADGFARVVISVEGMSCATCELAVRSALKRANGVVSARVSVASKTATVDYDPAQTNPQRLVAAINATGYRASLPGK